MIIPKSLHIQTTQVCNSKCITCDNWKIKNPQHTEISLDLFQKVFKEYKQINSNGQIHSIGHGEPFLYPYVFEFLKLVKEENLYALILTNSISLNEEKIDKLLDLKIDQINFSINSHIPEIHNKSRGMNNYNQVIKCIKYINNRTKVCINSILGNWNYDHFLDLIEFLKQLPIHQISFNLERLNYMKTYDSNIKKIIPKLLKDPMVYTNNTQLKDYCDVIDKLPRIPLKCSVSKNKLSIDPKGCVFLCFNRFNFILGNIKNESIIDIIKKPLNQKILHEALKCNLSCALNNCHF